MSAVSYRMFFFVAGVAKRDMAAVIDYRRVPYIGYITMVTGFSSLIIETPGGCRSSLWNDQRVSRCRVGVDAYYT